MQRLLTYFKRVGFTGYICIGDSSEGHQLVQNQKLIESAKSQLKIVYGEYPNLTNSHTIAEMVDSISTDYAVLLPDDDFLVPKSIQKCIEFLDKNPDYSAAHGKGIMINVGGEVYGNVNVSGAYNIRAQENDSGTARIENHLGNYSVNLFSVHRIESWRKMYKDVPKIQDAAFADELLPTSHAVVYGKIKILDCLYLVRHVHAGRYQHLDIFDWITSPNWRESYEIFLGSISTALAKGANVDIESAQASIKQGFWDYLSTIFHPRSNSRYSKKTRRVHSRIKDLVKRLPLVKSGWYQVRSFLPGDENELSKSALLRKSSRFHADFMPIYGTVTHDTINDITNK